MLTSLNIRNFVIVEKLDLEFFSGFTALTGETGAGKSLLIDALQLLFGGRSDLEFIKQGCDKTDLSATFSLTESVKNWLLDRELLNGEDELIIRRTLDIHGKSRSWINGVPSSLTQLKELSQLLVVVHGQHAHQSLLRKGSQLEMLDNYGKLTAQVNSVKQAWETYKQAQKLLQQAREQRSSAETEVERLKWFIEDLSELAPTEGEWEEINEEHNKLSRYTDIINACEKARVVLTEDDVNALTGVDTAISALEDIIDVDPKISQIYANLNEARDLIDSASSDVEHYLDRTDFDEERFAFLDQRLSSYLSLARKHHLEPSTLYEELERANQKLAQIEELSDLSALTEKANAAKEKYDILAKKLSIERIKVASKMGRKITEVMQTLAMEGGSFEISVTPTEPGPTGIDACEFLVAGHAGVQRRSLSKVASGGELARVSLAIAVTDTASATVPTLIFDEVDSGIGGAVAETVGRLLAQLGENQQVLCVTHLPQVASCASHHYKIEKIRRAPDQAPVSSVRLMDDKERIQEIARMLGGLEITAKTLDHAKEMLKKH